MRECSCTITKDFEACLPSSPTISYDNHVNRKQIFWIYQHSLVQLILFLYLSTSSFHTTYSFTICHCTSRLDIRNIHSSRFIRRQLTASPLDFPCLSGTLWLTSAQGTQWSQHAQALLRVHLWLNTRDLRISM